MVTKVTPADTFWEAEGYHQDYYERKGKLIRVDGEKKVDEVSDDIQVAVKDLL